MIFQRSFRQEKGTLIPKDYFKLSFEQLFQPKESKLFSKAWAKVYLVSNIEHWCGDKISYSLKFPCKPFSHHGC